jgi:hypothetical protein
MIRRNLPWLLLAISVVFNVFFVVGYLQARSVADLSASDDGIETLVRNELNLSEEQAAAFHGLRADMMNEAALLQNQRALASRELLQELDSEMMNLERLFDIVSGDAEMHREWRLGAMERMKQFVSMLTPEQKSKFWRHVHKRKRHRIPEHVMKRFDADGDGNLDEVERQAAKQHMDERWAEMRRKRLARFDANSNGKLDPDEEQAWRAWMQIRRHDKNGDGKLDADEQARADEHRRRREQDRLERFDANGNGVLDPEEQTEADSAERRRRGRGGGRRGGSGRRGDDRP